MSTRPAAVRPEASERPESYEAVWVPGDGIGPEVTEAAIEVVAETGVRVRWQRLGAGADCVERCGSPLPPEAVRAIADVGLALKGPIGTPIGEGFCSANVTLRV